MNKEKLFLKIINETISDNSYLGDDCAYLPDLNLVISQDTLVCGVHFLFNYFTPYELGKKAVIVNVSDILASGGVPKYITCSISGLLNEEFIEGFYKGANEICDKYGIKIIGGDLTGGDKISVSITILGDTKNRNISSLKYASVGQNVYIKGFSGSSSYGLKKLLEGDKNKEDEFIKAHIEPLIYPETSEIMAKTKEKYVMTDTSDGIYASLLRIKEESNVGFEIDYNKIPKKIDDKNLVIFGGEDFCLLICTSLELNEKEDFKKIGKVIKEQEIYLNGKKIEKDKSFTHF